MEGTPRPAGGRREGRADEGGRADKGMEGTDAGQVMWIRNKEELHLDSMRKDLVNRDQIKPAPFGT